MRIRFLSYLIVQINLIEDELNNQKCLEEEEKELNCRLGTMVLSDEPNNTEESEDLEVYHRMIKESLN